MFFIIDVEDYSAISIDFLLTFLMFSLTLKTIPMFLLTFLLTLKTIPLFLLTLKSIPMSLLTFLMFLLTLKTIPLFVLTFSDVSIFCYLY